MLPYRGAITDDEVVAWWVTGLRRRVLRRKYIASTNDILVCFGDHY
jgi:hypothetical protein